MRKFTLLRLFSVLLVVSVLLVFSVQGCSKDGLKKGCVMVEYVGMSDSPCGGPQKIKVLKGIEHIKAFYPGLKGGNGFIITADVPQDFRKPGSIFYFTAKQAKPKICTANVIGYAEVEISSISQSECL